MSYRKMSRGILDTHAFIWLMQGTPGEFSKTTLKLIERLAGDNELYLSAISLWELSMLESKGRIILSEPCLLWIQQALAVPGLNLVPLNPEISVDSANLPAEFHGDPADRIIVATARYLNAKLFTRDAKIINYAKAGYLEAIKI